MSQIEPFFGAIVWKSTDKRAWILYRTMPTGGLMLIQFPLKLLSQLQPRDTCPFWLRRRGLGRKGKIFVRIMRAQSASLTNLLTLLKRLEFEKAQRLSSSRERKFFSFLFLLKRLKGDSDLYPTLYSAVWRCMYWPLAGSSGWEEKRPSARLPLFFFSRLGSLRICGSTITVKLYLRYSYVLFMHWFYHWN